MPYFDRFDIVEAHYIYCHDYGDYDRMVKIDRMHFRPGLGMQVFGYDGLTENGKAIYDQLARAAKAKARKAAKARTLKSH